MKSASFRITYKSQKSSFIVIIQKFPYIIFKKEIEGKKATFRANKEKIVDTSYKEENIEMKVSPAPSTNTVLCKTQRK